MVWVDRVVQFCASHRLCGVYSVRLLLLGFRFLDTVLAVAINPNVHRSGTRMHCTICGPHDGLGGKTAHTASAHQACDVLMYLLRAVEDHPLGFFCTERLHVCSVLDHIYRATFLQCVLKRVHVVFRFVTIPDFWPTVSPSTGETMVSLVWHQTISPRRRTSWWRASGRTRRDLGRSAASSSSRRSRPSRRCALRVPGASHCCIFCGAALA